MNTQLLQAIAVIGPVLLFSVIAHEIAHGYAALRQGDPTAKELGRLTWNPIKHIDPFLTLLLPAVMYAAGGAILAGAKPVPVNPRNYREYRKGDIIVSLAGVATNFAIAVGCTVLIVVVGLLGRAAPALAPVLGYFQAMLHFGVLLNWVLIVFNLLPIPPLDGSHVLKHFLPLPLARAYVDIGGRFGFLILIALVFFWRDGLRLVFRPAFAAALAFLEPTAGFLLPEARAWAVL
ncbi:MAG TPA: site-2 protease family protein [Gemmatimonadaceae bacterium]|nr:site-2 protease family protein [Gemmatimonadaceae bacterium]